MEVTDDGDDMNWDDINDMINDVSGFIEKMEVFDSTDYHWAVLKFLANSGQHNQTYLLASWLGKTYQPKNVMEIGTRSGGSLIALLIQCRPKLVYCFDTWQEYNEKSLMRFAPNFVKAYFGMKQVKKNLKHLGIILGDGFMLSGDSRFTVPNFFLTNDTMFDYILVDGCHEPTVAAQDLENVADHVAIGGIIVFDDIGKSYNLLPVWERFKAKHNNFKYFETMEGKGIAFARRLR